MANKEAVITEGVIIKRAKEKSKVEEAYIPVFEIFAIIGIVTTAISLAELSYKIANWIIDKTHDKEVEVKVNGKKIADKEALQKILDELLKDKKI